MQWGILLLEQTSTPNHVFFVVKWLKQVQIHLVLHRFVIQAGAVEAQLWKPRITEKYIARNEFPPTTPARRPIRDEHSIEIIPCTLNA
jgi:hypothetical protein